MTMERRRRRRSRRRWWPKRLEVGGRDNNKRDDGWYVEVKVDKRGGRVGRWKTRKKIKRGKEWGVAEDDKINGGVGDKDDDERERETDKEVEKTMMTMKEIAEWQKFTTTSKKKEMKDKVGGVEDWSRKGRRSRI